MDLTEKMKASVADYFKFFNAQDAAGIAGLYAQTATVTDPVGTPAKKGKAAITAFYEMAVKNGAHLVQEGATRISGNIAAFAFTVHVGTGISAQTKAVDVELPSGGMTIDVIDTFEFDDEGKVTQMRAFWGPANITQI